MEQKYKWNVEKILDGKTMEEYQKLYEVAINEITKMRGKITESLENFTKYLSHSEDTVLLANRMQTYLFLKHSSDETDRKATQEYQHIQEMLRQGDQHVSFSGLEILDSEEKVMKYLKNNEISKYQKVYEEYFKVSTHRSEAKQNKFLKMFGSLISSPTIIRNDLMTRSLRFAPVRDKDGKMYNLFMQNLAAFLYNEDIELRKSSYQSLWSTINYSSSLLITLYDLHIKSQNEIAKLRHFNSVLDSFLFSERVDEEMFSTIIQHVEKKTNLVIQWKEIIAKITKIDNPEPWDWNGPLIQTDEKISIDDAIQTLKHAFKPLGKDYWTSVEFLFDNNLVDLSSDKNKRDEAFTSGNANVNPHISIKWDNSPLSLVLLAEQIGIAVHSLKSATKQKKGFQTPPLVNLLTSGVFTKYLLLEHVIHTSKNKKTQAFLLEKYIKDFLANVFNPCMCLEFEKWGHGKAREMKLAKDPGMDIFEKSRELINKYFPKTKNEKKGAPSDSLWSLIIEQMYRDYSVFKVMIPYISGISLASDVFHKEIGALKGYQSFIQLGKATSYSDALAATGACPRSAFVYTNIFNKLEWMIKTFAKLT